MTGSLQIKNNRYYAVINLATNGKRTQKWIASGYETKGNKRRAEQFLRDKLTEYEAKAHLVTTDTLFSDAVRLWLSEVALRVDVVTLQGYERLAVLHVIPYFETLGTKLTELDRQTLQAFFDEKRVNGRTDGKGGLSPRSLRMLKNVINQTLSCAVRDGYIASNPCQFLNLPPSEPHEAHFYDEEQLNALLCAVKDEPLYPVIKLTAVYGLRRSEVLGLKWDSVDFKTGTLAIKHTVSKVTKTVEKDKTKNMSSRRSFPLMPDIRELLLVLKAHEQENRSLFGREYHESDYILKWANGVPFSPDYVSQGFSSLLQKNGLPHIRFHELRHSCASFLLNSGFTLKDVQEWLGHSDIKMTANIYGHLDVARKQSIAATISSHLTGETTPLEMC